MQHVFHSGVPQYDGLYRKKNFWPQGNTQEDIPVSIKTEWIDDNTSASCPIMNSENDDSLPDYENSMLARSLLSGNIKLLFIY